MARTVRGARVLITGAASGMGRRYAERAVREGARAVVLWDRDVAALTALTTALRGELLAGRAEAWGSPPRSPSSSAGGPVTSIHPYFLDLGELGAIAQSAQAVRRELGGIDVLITTAGIGPGKYFWEHDNGEDIRPAMQVNALAPMYITREFLPGMIASPRHSRIVTIASTPDAFARPRMSVYAASTGAVIGWSTSVRRELEQQGFDQVKVTTVVLDSRDAEMLGGAGGPLPLPVLTPDYVVDRVWKAMLAGRSALMLPRSVRVARLLTVVLSMRAREAVT